MWPLNIARMLLLRGLKIDPPRNKLLWIILLKVVGILRILSYYFQV